MPLRDVVAEVAVIIAYTVVAAVSHGIEAARRRLTCGLGSTTYPMR